jgi:hypothetical protein
MSDYCTFDYAILRLVPRVELEEFFNVGVIVSCPKFKFLQSRTAVREGKLRCFDPELPLATVEEYLAIVPRICSGDADAGPIAGLTQRERFYWLTAQRSTIIQSSPVHTGLTEDPKATIDRLFTRHVR